jgi:hypothetical protein
MTQSAKTLSKLNGSELHNGGRTFLSASFCGGLENPPSFGVFVFFGDEIEN